MNTTKQIVTSAVTLIVASLVILVPATVFAASTFDNASSGGAGAGNTTYNISLTIAGGHTNLGLICAFSRIDTGTVTVSSATGGGGAWSKVGSTQTGNGNMKTEIWASIPTSSGAKIITPVYSGSTSGPIGGVCYSVYNVNQTTLATGIVSTGSGSLVVSIPANDLALSMMFDNNVSRTVSGCTTTLDVNSFTVLGFFGAHCSASPSSSFSWSGFSAGSIAVGVDVPQVATGGSSNAVVNPLSLNFSPTYQGFTSPGQNVLLSNTGGSTLNIASISASGDFADTTTCGATLATGSSCTITVTFSPTAGGTRTGTLTVTDDSGGVGGSTQTVSLSGTGIGTPAGSPPWTGILNSHRAIDWRYAGATIVNRASVCVTESPSTPLATINSDIQSCAATGGVVFLSAGTYNFSSCLVPASNVTIRGAGADQTKIVFSGGCSGIDGSKVYGVGFNGFFSNAFSGGPPGPDGADPSKTVTFAGTGGTPGVFSQGASVLTAGSTPTGLHVGDILDIVQNDDPNANVPENGFFVSSCTSTSSPACAGPLGGIVSKDGSGAGSACPPGGPCTGMRQNTVVLAVSGNNITIAPPLFSDQWSAAKSPILYWWGNPMHDAGIENLTLDVGTTPMYTVVSFFQCRNCWATGIASHETASRNHVNLFLSTNITYANNYLLGSCIGGCNGTSTGYQVESFASSSFLLENNVLDGGQTPFETSVGTAGGVWGLNFVVNQTGTDSTNTFLSHEEEFQYNLYEGNIGNTYFSDFFHGTQHFTTLYRNRLQSGGYPTVDVSSYNRWHNAVGNVLGDINSLRYNCLESNLPLTTCDRFHDTIYRLGIPAQTGDAGPQLGINPDIEVVNGFLRWGNWDTITSTNRTSTNDLTGIRWCGNSSDTGWSTTCASASEVPISDTWYPNSVPTLGDTIAGQGALPISFYRTAAPTYWPISVKPYPPIGPDVTNGNISNTGGHAYTNTAQDCYSLIAGNISNFNANTCYLSTSLTYTPNPLAFNPQPVNTTGAGSAITISNVGTGTVTLTSETLQTGTNFAISANTCGASLTVGSSCAVTITFTPLSSGALTDGLVVVSSDLGSPVVVSISGTGLSAPVIAPPTGLYTGAQTCTITDATPGAIIYYTLDGSTPTNASTLYSGGFLITTTTTVRSVAFLSGVYSGISTSVITITGTNNNLTTTVKHAVINHATID